MSNDSPLKALLVVTATALLCSILVTLTAVTLEPVQRAYQDLERIRFLIGVSGLAQSTEELPDREIVSLYQTLDAKIVDLDRGAIDTDVNAALYDAEDTARVAIPDELDVAGLGERRRLQRMHIVNENDRIKRVILPIHGQGMWSTIRGYIALEKDLNTIADITFYEQAETAGIGDKILRPEWQAGWRGRKIYDDSGTVRFRIGGGDSASLAARYQVDAISGATVTADAVTSMIAYWFGPHGYQPFLKNYRSELAP